MDSSLISFYFAKSLFLCKDTTFYVGIHIKHIIYDLLYLFCNVDGVEIEGKEKNGHVKLKLLTQILLYKIKDVYLPRQWASVRRHSLIFYC